MYLDHQRASVKIGPLICEGAIPSATYGSSCQSWRDLGMPSGYYIVEQMPHKKSM